MSSKSFLLFGLLLVTLMIISQGGAATSESHAEAKGVEDAKYGGGGYPGGGYQGGGGYPGGGYQGGGGYPGGGYQGGGGRHGGGGGGYCRYGCCGRRDYRGYCLRCCGLETQVEAKPHN